MFDVLTLPALLLVNLFNGRAQSVLAKAHGILDGLRGTRIAPEMLAPGAQRLW